MFFPHHLDQLVADGIEPGPDAFLAISSVLVVKGKVETQKVLQGARVSHSMNFFYTGSTK